MSLYGTAVRKPVSTALVFVAIVIFGLFSLSRLSVDLLPEIETNTIMVMTAYPGASASDIEMNVSKPLENVLNSVSDLKHITSQSRENISIVTLEFNYGNDYDTPDGSCIRDYINVVDLAKAHVIAMDRMLGGKTEENVEYFNLGTGNGVTVLELINTFEQATGVKVPHKIVGRREGDIEKVWANPERANKVLGWTAKETLADTLASAWKWQERLRERGIQ